MKVSKHSFLKIIQEEIRSAIEETPEQSLIRLLVSYKEELLSTNFEEPRSSTLLNQLRKDIKSIMPDMNLVQAIKSLEGKIDQQLYTFYLDALNKGSGGKFKSARQIEDPTLRKNPDPGFMRAPKSNKAYDQEDFRKHSQSLARENKMKLTKKYLRELVKESIEHELIKENNLRDLRNLNDAQLIQYFATVAKQLTNTDFTPEQISGVINSTPIPRQPVDTTPWSAPIKRDPTDQRPIPTTADEDPSAPAAPTDDRETKAAKAQQGTVAGKGQNVAAAAPARGQDTQGITQRLKKFFKPK